MLRSVGILLLSVLLIPLRKVSERFGYLRSEGSHSSRQFLPLRGGQGRRRFG